VRLAFVLCDREWKSVAEITALEKAEMRTNNSHYGSALRDKSRNSPCMADAPAANCEKMNLVEEQVSGTRGALKCKFL
jgi:hypothetical protein